MRDTSGQDKARFAGRYLLGERLHVGANTEVWLAEDDRAGIPVALKVLDASAAERPPLAAAFEREWQIARAINHPHTVRALGWHDGARPAYSMQYIDGTDFCDLVGRSFDSWSGPLLVIIDTLIYWHRKGIIHGDLKPSNFLLDRRGVAYLADFGAAIIAEQEGDNTIQDSGTPAYLSPERIAGNKPTVADDVYALARVMAELATGDPAGSEREGIPLVVSDMMRRALDVTSERPSLVEVRDALAAAGVTRGQVDLQALDINVRRPAASATRAEVAPEPLPHGAFESPQNPNDLSRDTSGVSLRQLLIGVVVIALFAIVFIGGLSWLAGPDKADTAVTNAEAIQVPAKAEEPEVEDATAEEATPTSPARAQSAATRADAEEVLGELLSVLNVLEQRAADRWAGASYTEGREVYERGDRAYLAGDYDQAILRYGESLALLKPLTERVNDVFEATMRDGDAALLNEDAVAARQAFSLALAITPGSALAQLGIDRADALDDVLKQMALGAIAENESDWQGALAAYESALSLDGLWAPAQEGITRVRGILAEIDFQQAMSRGLAALDEGRFSNASRAFNAAAQLKPQDRGPKDGLLQVRLAQRLDNINNLLADATASESREQWQQADALYQKVLEIDASLDQARQGALRVSNRQALETRTLAVLANPDRLSDTQALRDASSLLTQLQSLSPRGDRLGEQIVSLTDLLKTAALPRTVLLRSDGMTAVDVLRVERLGSFDSRELRLRPGLYTAVGRRRGYVDKRVQFRVLSDGETQPVTVVCDTPI
ncbi:MAG: protein kinase [Pseudomonadota bacterium]